MTRSNSLWAAVAASLYFVVTAPITTVFAAEVTPSQISAARTASDHEAIAASYDAEALAAEANAKKHEEMVRVYAIAERSPKNTMAQSMRGHCQGLVTKYRAMAEDYKALAAEHRKMAAAAGK